MMGFRVFMRRLAKNESGYSVAQGALLIALVAAVAGFGMLLLGNAISEDFQAAANKFAIPKGN